VKRQASKSLGELFSSGNHERVLSRTVDSPSGKFSASDISFIVGSLTFLGRIDEAQLLFERYKDSMSNDAVSGCRFFLGIALCRQSQYDKAKSYFITNLRESAKVSPSIVHFYAFQGVGFYRFFCGRFSNALYSAKRAFHAALISEFTYGKFLASDLIGHALIQTGQISAGLKMLSESLRYSKYLGGEADEGVRISEACYHAMFGFSPEKDIEVLQSLSKRLSTQDSYSHASLLLEMGRQYTLRGQLKASQEALNRACRFVYSSGHRRQGVTLNLRYAQNLMISGDMHQALNLIRSTLKELDSRVDKALELQVLGLELKLREKLGLTAPGGCLQARVKKLTQYTGMGIGKRIQSRTYSQNTALHAFGEDPLGDLMDKLKASDLHTDGYVETVLRSGYLSLLQDRLGVLPQDSVLYFDLIPDSILMHSAGEWFFQSKGVSPTIRSLARVLNTGECSKEQLIEKVWRYKYDRLRHDTLVYPAISRFRQMLGPFANWLEATEDGYRFSTQINVHFHQDNIVKANAKKRMVVDPQLVQIPISDIAPAAGAPEPEMLNFRQLTFLRELKSTDFVDVQAYKKKFKISKITATRDLSQLHQLDFLRRVGKGRATKYLSQTSPPKEPL
jgi:tetratricopeptide (TPR) repeat protein